MYVSRTEQVASTGQQIGRDVQLKNVLTGRKKRGTRAIPHTKSRRVEEGMLQNNGNNQLAEGGKTGTPIFQTKNSTICRKKRNACQKLSCVFEKHLQ